jgi:hypothetical protein
MGKLPVSLDPYGLEAASIGMIRALIREKLKIAEIP